MRCQDIDYQSIADGIDVLFSSLPYGVLMENLTDEIMDKVRIIDLGADYRFVDESAYIKHYGKRHLSPQLAGRFTYGLCEWNEENIRAAKHIANPGCYATAIELALIPLALEDMIRGGVIADGKCAVSGSGRTLTVGTHYAEANESVKAYKITGHPHEYESVKAIELFTRKKIDIAFVPHIVPMQRGMLITCYATLKESFDYEEVKKVYSKYYSDKQFVQLLEKGMYVETKWTRNSNMCHINFEVSQPSNRLVVVSAIDNLIKGAAGQAIQNMNIMFGLPQRAGLGQAPTCI
jgi:N-acetyl-gamma-glutamyl-phosphate reductase